VALIVAAAHHAPRTDASPIVPDGSWLDAYRVAVVVAFIGYTVAVALVRRGSIPLTAVLAVAALIQLVPLAAPLLLSRDVYTYWNKGRIEAVHGRDPFVTRPSAFPADVSYRYVAEDWRNRPSYYGPTMAAVSDAHALVVGTSARTAAYLYRLLAAASMLAIVAVVAALAARPSLGAVLVGWNPLLALHFAGGGHNDALMMALFLGAMLLAARSRSKLAAAVGVLGIAVKWIAAVFMPLELLRRPRRLAVTPWLVAGATLAAISFLVWGIGWLHSISALRNQANMVSSNSFAWWLSDHLGGGRVAWAHDIRLAFIVVYVGLIVLAWRTGRVRIGLTAGLLVAATPFLAPWYLVWPASLTAIEEDEWARVLVVALTAWLLRDAVSF
jgi:alpha-1,6-mannosyltransferase